MSHEPEQTHAISDRPEQRAPAIRSFRLELIEGPCSGQRFTSTGPSCQIGSHPSNDVVLEDATVSRFHCRIQVGPDGARLRDAESRNGTRVDGVRVVDAFLRTGSLVRLGASVVRFEYRDDVSYLPISTADRFGALVGVSPVARATFALMERAAERDVTLLIEGETGTGKSAAARALHQASARAEQPLVIVDCASIAGNLLESELFGHEKGAFTGATQRRIGAFEDASGGTVFLDEIGEVPIDLQAKLLRVLENREIRRIGANQWIPVDVRVIGATNRDLRAEVNAERFRADLYYRLAVITIELPPLRERPEDLPLLAEKLLAAIDPDAAELLTPEFLARLSRAAWPGNVRELRNYLERCVVFGGSVAMSSVPARRGPGVDTGVPFAEARKAVVDEFERAYLEALMHEHRGKVAAAARASGIDRVHMYRLLKRHGLRE